MNNPDKHLDVDEPLVSNCCSVSGDEPLNGGETFEYSHVCPKCHEHCDYVTEEN